MRILIRNMILLLCFLQVVACDSNVVFEKNIPIPDRTWNVNNRIKFDVEIQDTVSPHDIILNMRISESYPYANMYTYLTVSYPNGTSKKDTLQFILAEPSGRWLGNSSGSLIENPIYIHTGRRFGQSGTYSFEIEQAMQDENLEEVSDVGLRIQPTN